MFLRTAKEAVTGAFTRGGVRKFWPISDNYWQVKRSRGCYDGVGFGSDCETGESCKHISHEGKRSGRVGNDEKSEGRHNRMRQN